MRVAPAPRAMVAAPKTAPITAPPAPRTTPGPSVTDANGLPVVPGAVSPSYAKNGHPVIDTGRKDAAGHVPTHRLDQATNRQPNETWPQYEDRVIARDSFSPDTASRNDLASLEKPVADSAQSLLRAARAAGVSLSVGETKRTQERQEMLFQKGRKPDTGGTVTWTLTSDHTPGRAVDFNGSSKAFDWLQKNAPKFGFTVLGAMDPGHVSVP